MIQTLAKFLATLAYLNDPNVSYSITLAARSKLFYCKQFLTICYEVSVLFKNFKLQVLNQIGP
jgi:hypothetical protein